MSKLRFDTPAFTGQEAAIDADALRSRICGPTHPSRVFAMQRQQCSRQACHATFDSRAPQEQAVRYCNRSGPDGGHANRWTGTAWEAVADAMEHDRS